MGTLGSQLSIKLKEFRRVNSGESQGWLASKLGFSRATINRWETKGAGSATLDEVERIAAQMNKVVSELLGISQETPPSIEELARKVTNQAARIEELEAQLSLYSAQNSPENSGRQVAGKGSENQSQIREPITTRSQFFGDVNGDNDAGYRHNTSNTQPLEPDSVVHENTSEPGVKTLGQEKQHPPNPYPNIPADIVAMLSQIHPSKLDAVRALLRGMTVGKKKGETA